MSKYRYLFMYSGGCFFELARATIIVVIIGVLIHFFVFTIAPISGESMMPNFHSGDWVILNKIGYVLGKPARGDVVALRFPGDPAHEKYIKRIIGLPGEMVVVNNQGNVLINNQQLIEPYLPKGQLTSMPGTWTLRSDEYFLMGDNRDNSSDSRVWGVATNKDLNGRAVLIILPFSRFRYIYPAAYLLESIPQ